MNQKLMLPRHVAAERARQQHEAVAESIRQSSTNHLNSDDFVSSQDVERQIGELVRYMSDRRLEDPHYVLPQPVGWRVSVLMLTIPEESSGGVIMVDENREARALSSPQGVVLEIGPSAFKDPARFALEGGECIPWVSVGDRIIWKKYDVTTFLLANGQRVGFMNDTQAIATLDTGWLSPD